VRGGGVNVPYLLKVDLFYTARADWWDGARQNVRRSLAIPDGRSGRSGVAGHRDSKPAGGRRTVRDTGRPAVVFDGDIIKYCWRWSGGRRVPAAANIQHLATGWLAGWLVARPSITPISVRCRSSAQKNAGVGKFVHLPRPNCTHSTSLLLVSWWSCLIHLVLLNYKRLLQIFWL